MNENLTIKQFFKELKSSDFVLGCEMPLEYTPGLPMLAIKNENLCLQIPYLKYKTTGEKDKTLVFPIRYIITVSLPDFKFINYSDLAFEEIYNNFDFSKPIGFFRHEAIKRYNHREYLFLRNKYYSELDKIINHLLGDYDYTETDEIVTKRLFCLLLEPSLYKAYISINSEFCQKYLIGGKYEDKD